MVSEIKLDAEGFHIDVGGDTEKAKLVRFGLNVAASHLLTTSAFRRVAACQIL
jgi:hypothetical protein